MIKTAVAYLCRSGFYALAPVYFVLKKFIEKIEFLCNLLEVFLYI